MLTEEWNAAWWIFEIYCKRLMLNQLVIFSAAQAGESRTPNTKTKPVEVEMMSSVSVTNGHTKYRLIILLCGSTQRPRPRHTIWTFGISIFARVGTEATAFVAAMETGRRSIQ